MAVSQRFYETESGERVKSPTSNVVAVIHAFEETEDKDTPTGLMEQRMVLSDLSEDILLMNAAFGINVGVGNAYGGKSGEEAFEEAEARWETFTEGKWASGRQIGPRDSDVVLAFVEVKANLGQEVSIEDARKRFAEGGDLDAKEVAKYPEIKAVVDRLRLERLQERAAKSKAAAEGSDSSALAAL